MLRDNFRRPALGSAPNLYPEGFMRTAHALFALLLLAGCAAPRDTALPRSGGSAAPYVGASATGGETMNGHIAIASDDVASTASVPGERERLFPVLLQVYEEELNIPVVNLDRAGFVLGNPKFQVQRKLGGERLSRYFRCGSTMTGNIADQYRTQISAHSRLAPAGAGITQISTQITASAKNPETGDWVHCVSTGLLEERISKTLHLRASPAP